MFLPAITIKQYGLDCFIYKKPTETDIQAAKTGLSEVSRMIAEGTFDMVILDEACIAIYFNLFASRELIEILKSKPGPMEIIITGRYATAELIEFADLVTEMKEVKHYYTQGIEARKGIEF